MTVHKSSTRIRVSSTSLEFSSANKIRMGSSNIALRLDPAVALLYTSILNAATNARWFLHLVVSPQPYNHRPRESASRVGPTNKYIRDSGNHGSRQGLGPVRPRAVTIREPWI